MARPTKTTSGRWEIKGDPNDPLTEWELHRPGEKWRSKRTGPRDWDPEKVMKWIEDMEEWSEMIYEAVLELRECVSPIPVIQQHVVELRAAMEQIRPDVKPSPK